VKPFEEKTGHKVVVSYAASNSLAKQIEAGAPAAIFMSADIDWIEYVESRGLAVPGLRVDLLGNDLVLIAPASSPADIRIQRGFDLAGALGSGRLAIGNPNAVPAGKYAKAALQSLGAWDAVSHKVVNTENVRAACRLVSKGEAPLGIVYRTDAMGDKSVRVVDTFPANAYQPIVYPLVVLKKATPAGRSLASHLASPAMRSTWERFGFRSLQ
jgi:molybdate transport system substrate-binding protein